MGKKTVILLLWILGSAFLSGCASLPFFSHEPQEDLNGYRSEYASEDEGAKLDPARPYASGEKAVREALTFAQAGSQHWQMGDSKKALEYLDKAYAILLSIDLKAHPDLVQSVEDLRYTIARRIVQIQGTKATITKGIKSPIPMVMNEHVQEALSKFQGPLKDFFMRAYLRSGLYRPMIVKKLKEAGLPEELSWLPLIESGFNVRAFSPARALGLWQFIASTGHKYGLKRDNWIDERMDPEKATDAAILYLKELHGMFGDWTTALAAYNCGENNVLRVIRTQQIDYLDNFWDLYTRLPKETAFYVPQFIAVLHIVNSPDKFGFNLPQVDSPMEYDVVKTEASLSLKTLACTAGLESDTLAQLNPELRTQVTPPYPYELKVPKGKVDIILAALDKIPQERPDSIRKAAKEMNRTEVSKASNKASQPSKKNNAAKVSAATGSGANKRIHVVKKGETLEGIARLYGVGVPEIKAANKLKKSVIKAGQRLVVPIVSLTQEKSSSSLKKVNHIRYTVKKGDSLYSIAQRFNMDLTELMEINNLKDSSLFPGQVLTVVESTI